MTVRDRGLTIYFMDGSKLKFDFPKQVKSDEGVSIRLEKILTHQGLLAQADGALLLIPYHNIKYVQVFPSPSKLPNYVLTDGTLSE
jgi:hypothetical protein